MEEVKKNISFGIAGSGTAGLIAAIYLRKAFPNSLITIVSSTEIGIIGVGEGSTEHWRSFMELCDIGLEEMIVESSATHKYGIRFENWSSVHKDYFHSVGRVDDIYAHNMFATYMGFLEQGKTLTSQTSSVGMVKNKISRQHLHNGTNQFHFDTFKLNNFFSSLCFKRHIRFVEGKIEKVNINEETKCIESVGTHLGDTVYADFWFDATGFSRILMKALGNTEWKSFDEYLLCDSAIAFPTESDPSGQIKPYTRARAMSAGWVWEIPTQERRGNGYVYSSKFIDEEKAIAELEKIMGYKVTTHRSFKFNPGYLKNAWVKNCSAIGLASSFVEPLEATSIGSSIQHMKLMIPYLSSYIPENHLSQKDFNRKFESIMRNILTMLRLHYWSDRRDSPFWAEQANMPVNSELQELIDVWSERPPVRTDVDSSNGELFQSPHLIHVAQGQGLINIEACSRALDSLGIRQRVGKEMDQMRHDRHSHELVDHAEALREISQVDEEWLS